MVGAAGQPERDMAAEQPAGHERRQAAELLIEGLQARGLLAVGLRAAHQLLLDTLLRIVTEVQVLEFRQLEAHHPGRLAIEHFEGHAELARRGADARIALLAQQPAQRRAGRQPGLVQWIAGPQSQTVLAQHGWIPGRMSVGLSTYLSSPMLPPSKKVFTDATEHVKAIPLIADWSDIDSASCTPCPACLIISPSPEK